MKDKEFIELLNLYLDHEISTKDAARLEAEVQRNPARYQTYRDYCKLHKGCTLLTADYATAPHEVTAWDSPVRRWVNPFAIGGLMAAAACAAFIVLNRPSVPATENGMGVVQQESPRTTPKADAVAADNTRSIASTVTVSTRTAAQPMIVKQTFPLAAANEGTSSVQDPRFNWMADVQLASIPQIPAESLRFETKGTQKPNQRSFGSAPLEGPMEYNAIQFQR